MPKVRFETLPPGAATFLCRGDDSRYVGTTPFTMELPAGEVEVLFWKGGFVVAKYRDLVAKDGAVVGTSLEENDEVPAPQIPEAASSSRPVAPTQLAEGGSSTLVWALALVGVVGLGGGAYWWYRRRGKRGSRQLRASAPERARLTTGRPTKVRGLGAAETSCSPVVPGSVAVRTCITRPAKRGPLVDSVAGVCKLLSAAKNADRESFFTISFDPGMHVLGVEETHKGAAASVDVHPREVFKSAMLLNASAVIVAHNHPSGEGAPSREDEQLTRRIVKAGRIVGIPVLDHIVIASQGCESLAQRYPRLFENQDEPG